MNFKFKTKYIVGHYFQAINPESFRTKEEYENDIEVVIETLRSVKPSDPDKPVLVPGEPEQISRKDRQKNGIPVNRNLRNLIKEIAQNAGVEYFLVNNTTPQVPNIKTKRTMI